MKIYLILLLNCVISRFKVSSHSFLYEKLNNFGLGKKVIQNYRLLRDIPYAYPEPLPSTRHPPLALYRTSHQNIYQGFKKESDLRVYNKKFNYKGKEDGHKVFCRGEFHCTISHLAVETRSGIPILLRGGAGYRYFVVIAKAKPGEELKGRVMAYCRNETNEYYKQVFSMKTSDFS